jgi:hypothetical protein
VASGIVSGLSGKHKFHFLEILEGWIKIDVKDTLAPNVQLMMENRDTEQEKVKDAIKSLVIWNQKFLKCMP